MPHSKKILRTALAALCMSFMLLLSHFGTDTVLASDGYEFVVLSQFEKTMSIGDTFYLIAITSNGKKPRFSSSSSAVASVNTYGMVTAKKAGSATITVKIRGGEASCRIIVNKTQITLSAAKISLENGTSETLTASASTGHPVTFRSSKPSIASIDENGVILAKKPGEAVIIASADKTSVSCKITVKKPSVSLSGRSASLYRGETVRLSAASTSKSKVKWKSSKKSVAAVDENGKVTAIKNGKAVITATVDGISKTCQITVKKPEIYFSEDSITLRIGECRTKKASISSKNKPEYSSSNDNVASVDQNGTIRAKSAGKAYIYAKEDGAKARLTVIVKPQ